MHNNVKQKKKTQQKTKTISVFLNTTYDNTNIANNWPTHSSFWHPVWFRARTETNEFFCKREFVFLGVTLS
jgi:hypothetical protein